MAFRGAMRWGTSSPGARGDSHVDEGGPAVGVAGRRASGGAPHREEHWLNGPLPFVGPGSAG